MKLEEAWPKIKVYYDKAYERLGLRLPQTLPPHQVKFLYEKMKKLHEEFLEFEEKKRLKKWLKNRE